VTGHHAATEEFADWPAKIPTDATVVVYMPGYDYANTAEQLLRAGVSNTTPCAIVSQATSSGEQVHLTTVENLALSPRLPSPTLLVVGEVVRLAEPSALRREFAWAGDAVEFATQDPVLSAAQERAE